MIVSLWRYAHLSLAILSAVLVILASITGAILAFEPLVDKVKDYKVTNFEQISLAESIAGLKQKYPDLTQLHVTHHQFVIIKGFDEEGNEFHHVVNPITGVVLGKPIEQSVFMQWTTTLHRSLFMHQTGRFIVGVFCFLLLLITITGTALLLKKQGGIQRFFAKMPREGSPQYYHSFLGRLMLIPILVITLSGTYLFLLRFECIKMPAITAMEAPMPITAKQKQIKDFPAFQHVYLSDIKTVEFPIDDSPEEYYTIKTKRGEWLVSQVSGEKVNEIHYPMVKVIETISVDWHTGRSHFLWSIVLLVAAVNILIFIYTGFSITLKRKFLKKYTNCIAKSDAELVLLVGSESGTTWFFAKKIYQQLLLRGKKIYIASLNEYEFFPSMKELLIFTATYGQGEAPSNATHFEKKLLQHTPPHKIRFAVVGFGSKQYPDYCAYALKIHTLLSNQKWAFPLMDIVLIHQRSTVEFAYWAKLYNLLKQTQLSEKADFYSSVIPAFKKFTLLDKTYLSEEEDIFRLSFATNANFESGDLLAIYPANDAQERLYSIAKIDGKLTLLVKLHPQGLGSGYLYDLSVGQTIKARIMPNPSFHLPKNKPAIFIANGTGIAPFLGMLSENSPQPFYLYAGFKRKTPMVDAMMVQIEDYRQHFRQMHCAWAFSKENTTDAYVMDLLSRDEDMILALLDKGAVVLVCGSLQMWKDVESLLCNMVERRGKNWQTYKDRHQILVDCY